MGAMYKCKCVDCINRSKHIQCILYIYIILIFIRLKFDPSWSQIWHRKLKVQITCYDAVSGYFVLFCGYKLTNRSIKRLIAVPAASSGLRFPFDNLCASHCIRFWFSLRPIPLPCPSHRIALRNQVYPTNWA